VVCVFVIVFLCVGFSRRVRGSVLFLPVINSSALSSVSCDLGWLFCIFVILLVLCV
jgi:hypothetical protein